jgi:hypothetical protein
MAAVANVLVLTSGNGTRSSKADGERRCLSRLQQLDQPWLFLPYLRVQIHALLLLYG